MSIGKGKADPETLQKAKGIGKKMLEGADSEGIVDTMPSEELGKNMVGRILLNMMEDAPRGQRSGMPRTPSHIEATGRPQETLEDVGLKGNSNQAEPVAAPFAPSAAAKLNRGLLSIPILPITAGRPFAWERSPCTATPAAITNRTAELAFAGFSFSLAGPEIFPTDTRQRQ